MLHMTATNETFIMFHRYDKMPLKNYKAAGITEAYGQNRSAHGTAFNQQFCESVGHLKTRCDA